MDLPHLTSGKNCVPSSICLFVTLDLFAWCCETSISDICLWRDPNSNCCLSEKVQCTGINFYQRVEESKMAILLHQLF